MKSERRSFDEFEARITAVGLSRRIAKIALRHHVTLRDLYEGTPTASVVAARKDVYTWLKKNGKSPKEIGKLFDRAHNGIVKMLRSDA